MFYKPDSAKRNFVYGNLKDKKSLTSTLVNDLNLNSL